MVTTELSFGANNRTPMATEPSILLKLNSWAVDLKVFEVLLPLAEKRFHRLDLARLLHHREEPAITLQTRLKCAEMAHLTASSDILES